MICDVMIVNFPDADNFEPKVATTLTSSNKWEGEDEEETVKVGFRCQIPTLFCHHDLCRKFFANVP